MVSRKKISKKIVLLDNKNKINPTTKIDEKNILNNDIEDLWRDAHHDHKFKLVDDIKNDNIFNDEFNNVERKEDKLSKSKKTKSINLLIDDPIFDNINQIKVVRPTKKFFWNSRIERDKNLIKEAERLSDLPKIQRVIKEDKNIYRPATEQEIKRDDYNEEKIDKMQEKLDRTIDFNFDTKQNKSSNFGMIDYEEIMDNQFKTLRKFDLVSLDNKDHLNESFEKEDKMYHDYFLNREKEEIFIEELIEKTTDKSIIRDKIIEFVVKKENSEVEELQKEKKPIDKIKNKMEGHYYEEFKEDDKIKQQELYHSYLENLKKQLQHKDGLISTPKKYNNKKMLETINMELSDFNELKNDEIRSHVYKKIEKDLDKNDSSNIKILQEDKPIKSSNKDKVLSIQKILSKEFLKINLELKKEIHNEIKNSFKNRLKESDKDLLNSFNLNNNKKLKSIHKESDSETLYIKKIKKIANLMEQKIDSINSKKK